MDIIKSKLAVAIELYKCSEKVVHNSHYFYYDDATKLLHF